MTGNIVLGMKYKNAILNQIKKEINPSENVLMRMNERLNKASADELERMYEAFERFGVRTIMDLIET